MDVFDPVLEFKRTEGERIRGREIRDYAGWEAGEVVMYIIIMYEYYSKVQ